MNVPDLKPCPFCGGKALLSHDHAGIEASYVRCEKCGLESIRFLKSFECASDDRAVEFWNRRADNGRVKTWNRCAGEEDDHLMQRKKVLTMTEYIERKALRDTLYDADAITMSGVKILNQFPGADVAPVRHGRWIEHKHFNHDHYIDSTYECSECNVEEPLTSDYCPNCGAKMDLEG